MSTVLDLPLSSTFDLSSDAAWIDCINLLRSYAKHFVYSANVTCWRGQEEDLVEDIVQETVRRAIERYQRAEAGELLPIYSLKHMIVTIARNYSIDMWRRDCRLHYIVSDGDSLETSASMSNQMSPLDAATENVYRVELFSRLAYEIVRFPAKQRRALLIDLANRMHFDTELTALQKAFLAEGIDLKEYQRPLPSNLSERANQSSLLSLAYKRVTICMSKYVSDK